MFKQDLIITLFYVQSGGVTSIEDKYEEKSIQKRRDPTVSKDSPLLLQEGPFLTYDIQNYANVFFLLIVRFPQNDNHDWPLS